MKIPHALHFVGIGGMGMSAIAQVWHGKGRRVTGSDASASGTVQRLRDLGIEITIGHDASHVGPDVEGMVLSTAVHTDNPEVVEARRRGIPTFHRSHILGALMREKQSIAVTGTHGKTTTSAMIASILVDAGVDPTVLLGGDLPDLGGNARSGEGPFLVAEADESDKSLINLFADIVVVTNLEGDHLEHYRDLDEIIEVVARFINDLPAGARVVACADDAGVARLLKVIPGVPVTTYGFTEGANVRLVEPVLTASGSTFHIDGKRFALQVPGKHNIENAGAAIAACQLLGIETSSLQAGLAGFTGVKRRFQTVGTIDGITVIDDYAHHPSEIKATLAAASLLKRPVHAVFQPHRHSRLEALLDDFAASFDGARTITILETYAAGEAPRQVTATGLADLIRTKMPDVTVTYVPTREAVVAHLAPSLASGDLVLLLGAGDIHMVAPPLLLALEARLSLRAQTA